MKQKLFLILLIMTPLLLIVLGFTLTKMANEKVVSQETITDNPFPQRQETGYTAPKTGTIKDQAFPIQKTATRLISSVLNTASKKILGVFKFTQSGAIQIGNYVSGSSGDIKISPAGIVARNKDGDTTVAIDGDTGDATFKGTVQAADFVIADENGLVSINTFKSDSYSADDEITTDSVTFTEISESELSFTLVRNTRVLFFITASVGIVASTETDALEAGVRVGDTNYEPFISKMTSTATAGDPQHITLTAVVPALLAAGDHTAKIIWRVDAGDGFMTGRSLSYLVLGT